MLTHSRGRAACRVRRSKDTAAQATQVPRTAPGACLTSESTFLREQTPTHPCSVHPFQTVRTQTLTKYVVAPDRVEEPQCCGGRSPACGGKGLQAAIGTSRPSTETDTRDIPSGFLEVRVSDPTPVPDCWKRASAACDALATVQSNRRGGTLAFRDAFSRLRDALAACPASATREAAEEQCGPQFSARTCVSEFCRSVSP